MYTVFDVPPRQVNGQLVELELQEKQRLVNKWNDSTVRERVAKHKMEAQQRAEAAAHKLGFDIAYAKMVEFLDMEKDLKGKKAKDLLKINKALTQVVAKLNTIQTYQDLLDYEATLP